MACAYSHYMPVLHASVVLHTKKPAYKVGSKYAAHYSGHHTSVLCRTPANWPNNHDSIGKKGWSFILPTVTPEVRAFPGGTAVVAVLLAVTFYKHHWILSHLRALSFDA